MTDRREKENRNIHRLKIYRYCAISPAERGEYLGYMEDETCACLPTALYFQ